MSFKKNTGFGWLKWCAVVHGVAKSGAQLSDWTTETIKFLGEESNQGCLASQHR